MTIWTAFRDGLLFAALLGLAPAPAQTERAVSRPTVGEKISAAKDLLDINTATAAQLRALPGMGDAYVARILAGRPYTAKNQLTTRGILPAAAYEGIKGQIVAHRGKKQE